MLRKVIRQIVIALLSECFMLCKVLQHILLALSSLLSDSNNNKIVLLIILRLI